jgi:flagellar basal body-associated protein FliL
MTEKDKEAKGTEKDDSSKSGKTKTGILAWIIMLLVVTLLSGSGFIVGRLIAGDSKGIMPSAAEEPMPAEPAKAQKGDSKKAPAGTWYYNDLQSVIVNPDEPGATRFVRVALILEVSNELTQEKARELFQAKSPLLVNWLNLYFKSLSLSQMENDRDIKRILSQVCDGFNEILFPETKPLIQNVLIREFNIQ